MASSTNDISSVNYRRKFALVIGNGNYSMSNCLPNATNDAKEIVTILKRIGFRIYENEAKLNLTFDLMHRILSDFVRGIKQTDIVLFFFAGHGIQWENQNYLIPVDDFKEENSTQKYSLCGSDLRRYAINAQHILNEIEDCHPFLTLFFLDCCRIYPLPEKKNSRGDSINTLYGLKSMPARVGSLIAFACAPGTTADDGSNGEKNGLFTKYLLKHLQTPNEDIEKVLRRVRIDVMNESNNQQIPHSTSLLTYEHICLFDGRKESTLSRWSPNGKSVAGGNGRGRQLNQLNNPCGIFVDKNENIFIADCSNHRIVKWNLNESEGTVVVGENGKGERIDQLYWPTDMIADGQNNSLIIVDWGNNRVVRWWDQNQQDILFNNISCSRLIKDRYGFLYASDFYKNEVRRWMIGEKWRGRLVAGGHGQGNRLNQFNNPSFIFVDKEQSIYVSDCGNDRVMKWRSDAQKGVIVAGGNGEGDHLNQLNYPEGVIVDKFGQIYVADCNNHRIMRWREGDEEGEIIAGGNGKGEEMNQLAFPKGLAVDLQGNLYVADSGNHRIQRYDLIYE
ncbi:unnamed protein product [Adineta ricciae]|uniref:Caspase family p20 domain-containing protein n=1 Tax=Adineta ricciae TaxID=249248 RepID=A0A815HCT4_ADIRI|nr:unnamed protein product [Adineta ricciae]CAF1350642.1 unnamed protein product [Adineta ricciae]